jgi:molybdopterin molybdotransferase
MTAEPEAIASDERRRANGMSTAADVRMQGFRRRSEVPAVLAWIDKQAIRLGAESVPVEQATGRVLASDVVAAIDVPGFDRSAMDGYGVRGDDTSGASEYNPIALPVEGHVLPAQPLGREVAPHTAVRIMTGAPIPQGVDAVVPAEFATEVSGTIEITRPVAPGQHVAHRGEDVAAGSVVLRAGRRLRAQDVALVASLGQAQVDAVRRPRVRIVATGNEVVAPGGPKDLYQVYDANSYMLRGLVARDGATLEGALRLGDDPAAIRDVLTTAGADVILVSGGSSVGSEDHAPRLVAECGELAIHGVAMRPSSPAGAGRVGDALVFLLPGNPVSCLCAYDFFAGRAIRAMGGLPAGFPHRTVRARVARKIVSAIGRVDYCRVKLADGEVEPIALSGASILSSTTRADGFVIVPAESEGYGPGSDVTVYLYD